MLGPAQAPQGMGTAPKLSELQEHLNTGSQRQEGIIGVSVQGFDDPCASLPAQEIV